MILAGGWVAAWAGGCGSDVTDGSGAAANGGAAGANAQTQGGATPAVGGAGGVAQGGHAGTAGAPPAPCAAADGDYGDCDLALGWAFDGEDCVSMSGCGCDPDCDAFAQDFASCAAACAGHCDSAAFVGEGIAADGWGAGDFCDSISTCVKADVIPLLEEVVTAVDCTSNGPCGGNDGQRCTFGSGEVTDELMDELCAATLIEDVDEIACFVIGP